MIVLGDRVYWIAPDFMSSGEYVVCGVRDSDTYYIQDELGLQYEASKSDLTVLDQSLELDR